MVHQGGGMKKKTTSILQSSDFILVFSFRSFGFVCCFSFFFWLNAPISDIFPTGRLIPQGVRPPTDGGAVEPLELFVEGGAAVEGLAEDPRHLRLVQREEV